MARDTGAQVKVEACIIHGCNFIFAIFGILLMAFGGVGVAGYTYISTLAELPIFHYILAAGVFVFCTALVGSLGAHFVLGGSDKNSCHCTGKILLLVYWIVMLAFIVAQIATSVIFFSFTGQIEQQATGNTVLDSTLSSSVEYVDKVSNCTFNYCCGGWTSPSLGRRVSLVDPINYDSLKDRDAAGRTVQETERSKAATFLVGTDNLGEANFVPEETAKSWEANDVGKAKRDVFEKQYYSGPQTFLNVIGNQTDPSFNKAEAISRVEQCDSPDASGPGLQCWVKWRAMCPNPLDIFTFEGWNEVCDFVNQHQTWIANDTPDNPNPTRTPMLDNRMCNMLNGTGVNDPDFSFKQAVIWKMKSTYPVGVGILVLGVLELILLVAVCCAVFHRAHPGADHHSAAVDMSKEDGDKASAVQDIEEGKGGDSQVSKREVNDGVNDEDL
jgi:hypothetical protein